MWRNNQVIKPTKYSWSKKIENSDLQTQNSRKTDWFSCVF